jgi:hopanoid biosynthesis associated RND transporter like protein HpnN
MAAIRAIGRDVGVTPERGMRLRLTGTVALQDEELESVAGGTGLAGVASLVLVSLFLVVGLGSLRLVFATLATLIVGLIWTGAFAVAALGAFNMVSVAFVVLFIGLGVDFGIHFALRHREAVLSGRAPGEALRHAAARLIRPLSLCAITNVIAFFAFAPTSYRGVADLGIISGVGMIVALFCNFTVLPAILTLLPLRKPGDSRIGAAVDAAAARIGGALGHGGRPVVIGAGVLALAALAVAPALRFDPDPLHLKDPTTESVQTMFELLADRETGSPAISVLLPDLEAARAMAARLQALPEVDRVVDVGDYVPKRQDEKRAMIDQTALFLLPSLSLGTDAPPTPQEEREALRLLLDHLDRLLAQGEVPVPQAVRLRHELHLFLNGPGDTDAGIDKLRGVLMDTLPARLQELRRSLEPQPVTLADLPADLVARLQAPGGLQRLEIYPAENVVDPAAMGRFVRAVQAVAPAATGGPVAIVEAGDSVVRSVVQALTIAAVFIVIVLYGVLGTVRDTALVIAPVLLAAVLAVGTVVLLGMAINFANVIAVPLLLGLGVDSCIHIVSRAREQADVRSVLASSTSRAVLFSALTTVGSFGTLMLSHHRGTASIGELLAITIGLTLVCALVVLPALIEMLGGAARTAPEARDREAA